MSDRPSPGPDAGDADDDQTHDRRDYDVGYGKPPRKSQFKPGQSGNPRGRPRGAKGLKRELRKELDEWVTVTTEGRPKRIRKRRLILKALIAKAAKGNVAAAERLIALIIQTEGIEDERPGRRALSDTDELILRQFLRDEGATDPPQEAKPETDETAE
ncbi:MAG: DUF5681 domain-containing protein [Allosphingosinicella sp.]